MQLRAEERGAAGGEEDAGGEAAKRRAPHDDEEGAQNLYTPRAERQPNADLALALLDDEGEDAEDPDRGQDERQRADRPRAASSIASASC